jgi:hypothetical protein
MATLTRSNQYIAFIDVLGFRQFIDDQKFANKIELLVAALRQRIDFDSKRHPYLKYLAVSDSIIIMAEPNRSASLLWKISQVQNALLKIGFASRGGIAFGEVYAQFDTSGIRNIFGKAYVAAYKIEKSLAIYPRVVIDAKLANKIRSEIPGTTKYTYEDFVRNDIDGCLFANQFVRDEVHLKSDSKKLFNEAGTHRAEYLKFISRGVKTKDAKALMKWRWLKGQLTECLTAYRSR